MTLKINYTPLMGGIDVITGSVMADPGMLSQGVNFEQVFGKVGYRRVDGYERFDGQPQPHKVQYYRIDIKDGALEPLLGQTVVTGSGSGVVLDFILDSGDWNGTAEGVLIYATIAGSFTTGQTLKETSGAGATMGTTDSEPQLYRTQSQEQNFAYRKIGQTARRLKIGKVPGSGPVRGVAVYKGNVYAFRDTVGGESLTMWGSSASGWVSVKAGLRPGGRYDFVVSNFSGDAAQLSLFGVDGVNPPFMFDGAYHEILSIYGSTAVSNETITVGTGMKSFSVVESNRSWVNGDKLYVYSADDPSKWMAGEVTDYTSPNVTLSVTDFGGSGSSDDWRIGALDGGDIPYLVASHKDHLFLAYPRGQLQTSNLGDPLTYTTSAALFGMGSEITALISLKGAMFGIFCEDKIELLEGSNKDDWVKAVHAPGVGARMWTSQENAGNALMLEERGLVSLQATQNFGYFEPAIWSRNVQPMLSELRDSVTASRMVRGKYQYRLYFEGGRVLSACITNPAADVRPKDVAFMTQEYAHSVVCVGTGVILGEEGMFFGTTDGWVMQEDVGQSFDGEPIEAALQMHFNHMKELEVKKRFRKITIEADAEEQFPIQFLQIFDLDDGQFRRSIARGYQAPGKGGSWDADEWDTFAWSLPAASLLEANVDGRGRSVALLIWCKSDIAKPISLQGLTTLYSPLGVKR